MFPKKHDYLIKVIDKGPEADNGFTFILKASSDTKAWDTADKVARLIFKLTDYGIFIKRG